MKLLDTIKPLYIKIILSINLFMILFYSFFIIYFDEDLILGSISSQKIFFNYIFLKILIGLFFFFSSVLIVRITNFKKWLWIIILFGLTVRIILIPAYPVVENDFYRYLWDGAVTANGINPYKFSPKEALEGSNKREVPAEITQLAEESDEIIHRINHPHIRTIYPPIAQIVFAASYLIFPWKLWGLKLFFLIFDLSALLLLLKVLKEYNKSLLLVFIYWLNPIIIHEYFAAEHMDVLLVPFLILILYLALKNSYLFSSVFIALASAVKIWPIVFIPLVLRNLWNDKKKFLLYLFAASLLTLLLFLPVLVTVFDRSLGFVVYAQSWTNNEAVFKIIHFIINQIKFLFDLSINNTLQFTRYVTGFSFLFFLIFIIKRNIDEKEIYFEKFLLITAVLFFISPTQFPWYFSWVVPFLVFRPMISLLLYPVFLPLYQLNYISPYIVFVQHIPVLFLFLYEIKTKKWNYLFFSEKKEEKIIFNN